METTNVYKINGKNNNPEEQPTLQGILPPKKLSDLHVVALKVLGGKDSTTLEFQIRGDLQTNNLESISDLDYYTAFMDLANAFLNHN